MESRTPFGEKGQNPGKGDRDAGFLRRVTALRGGPPGPALRPGRTGEPREKTAGAEPSSLRFFPPDTHFQTCYLYKAVRAARAIAWHAMRKSPSITGQGAG